MRVLVYSAEEVFSTLWYILEALTVVAFFTSCGLSIMYEIDTVPSVDLGKDMTNASVSVFQNLHSNTKLA